MTSSGDIFDVLVIGGGAAGLSAGVVLARARRSVAVVDAGAPRNAPAEGVHSFLSRDGMPPAELLAAGRAELAEYGGMLIDGWAESARRDRDGLLQVALAGGSQPRARAVLVATGLVDELPEIPGLRDRWGRDVVHCPYCHGWEIRDREIGVVGSGPIAVRQALMFRQWSADVVLFVHTAPQPDDEQAEQLAARGIGIVEGPVIRVESAVDRLTGVRMADGRLIPRQALAVGGRMIARSPVLDSLGVTTQPHPFGEAFGASYAADPTGAAGVPGVWVAGNVTDLQAGVIGAAAQGVSVAAAINGALIEADTAAAVQAARERVAAGVTGGD